MISKIGASVNNNLSFNGIFKRKSKKQEVKNAPIEIKPVTPCKGSSLSVALAKDDIVRKDGKYYYRDGRLVDDLVLDAKTKSGARVYCMMKDGELSYLSTDVSRNNGGAHLHREDSGYSFYINRPLKSISYNRDVIVECDTTDYYKSGCKETRRSRAGKGEIVEIRRSYHSNELVFEEKKGYVQLAQDGCNFAVERNESGEIERLYIRLDDDTRLNYAKISDDEILKDHLWLYLPEGANEEEAIQRLFEFTQTTHPDFFPNGLNPLTFDEFTKLLEDNADILKVFRN